VLAASLLYSRIFPGTLRAPTCTIVNHTRIKSRIAYNHYTSIILTLLHYSPRVIPSFQPLSLLRANNTTRVFCTEELQYPTKYRSSLFLTQKSHINRNEFGIVGGDHRVIHLESYTECTHNLASDQPRKSNTSSRVQEIIQTSIPSACSQPARSELQASKLHECKLPTCTSVSRQTAPASSQPAHSPSARSQTARTSKQAVTSKLPSKSLSCSPGSRPEHANSVS